MTKYEWYEVYVDDVHKPPLVLFLYADLSGNCHVYDPASKSTVYSSDSYEDAKAWLNEDEYYMVRGRSEVS